MLICKDPQGFMRKITIKLEEGNVAHFWKTCWLGRDCLEDHFPKLYKECSFKNYRGNSTGVWHGDVCGWRIIYGEEVIGREVTSELEGLKVKLYGIYPVVNVVDMIIWPFDTSKVFTTRPCYVNFNPVLGVNEMYAKRKQGLSIIWGSYVP